MNNKPFNPLQESDKEPKPDLMEISKQSHYEKSMSGDYNFLQLTPENISTYQLGFYSGCIHVTQGNIKELEAEHAPTLHRQTGIADNKNHEAIN